MTTNTLPEQAKTFWDETAKRVVQWDKPWHTLLSGGFEQGDVQWFLGGKLNVSSNCLDRHLPHHHHKTAIIYEGDEPSQTAHITFGALHQDVCRMANVLKSLNITKGSRVGIYLPMIPEAAIAMLACARIGAVHTVVFAGFSPQSLKMRLEAAECSLLITANAYQRGGKSFALKAQADEATLSLALKTLVIAHTDAPCPFDPARDVWWHEAREHVSADCEAQPMDAEDPLFILYTSGSTGKPKGLVHTTGGYLVQAAFSHDHLFQCQQDDVFWCTADIGWITGHTYVIYGALCNGVTTLMFSGVPNWPTPARCFEIIDAHHVSVFYTAPTAIRALKRAGDQWLDSSHRDSLRLLGSVGEPINPEVWEWYKKAVGKNRCPIIDTWWQTETGAAMLAPPSITHREKPGAACQPLPGIYPVLLDEQFNEVEGEGSGALAIRHPWPAIARTVLGSHARYKASYFKNGYYLTGDGSHRDKEGDYWITGRLDDVLNVSGHRIGSAEIENVVVQHPKVAEAAAIGLPHDIKGEAIALFVSLKPGQTLDDTLVTALQALIVKSIGKIAKPDTIQAVSDLPKTRSGKIMRRILRKIASHEAQTIEELGDLSTLANPEIVEKLLKCCC